jgi:hypothetical protein
MGITTSRGSIVSLDDKIRKLEDFMEKSEQEYEHRLECYVRVYRKRADKLIANKQSIVIGDMRDILRGCDISELHSTDPYETDRSVKEFEDTVAQFHRENDKPSINAVKSSMRTVITRTRMLYYKYTTTLHWLVEEYCPHQSADEKVSIDGRIHGVVATDLLYKRIHTLALALKLVWQTGECHNVYEFFASRVDELPCCELVSGYEELVNVLCGNPSFESSHEYMMKHMQTETWQSISGPEHEEIPVSFCTHPGVIVFEKSESESVWLRKMQNGCADDPVFIFSTYFNIQKQEGKTLRDCVYLRIKEMIRHTEVGDSRVVLTANDIDLFSGCNELFDKLQTVEFGDFDSGQRKAIREVLGAHLIISMILWKLILWYLTMDGVWDVKQAIVFQQDPRHSRGEYPHFRPSDGETKKYGIRLLGVENYQMYAASVSVIFDRPSDVFQAHYDALVQCAQILSLK